MTGALGSAVVVELCVERIRRMATPLTIQHLRTSELLSVLLLDLLENEVHTVLVYLLLCGTVDLAMWIVTERERPLQI